MISFNIIFNFHWVGIVKKVCGLKCLDLYFRVK